VTNRIFILLLSFSIVSGCASRQYRNGLIYIEKKEYDNAIQSLLQAEVHKPESFKIKRELGYAYFLSGRLESAIEKFSIAQKIQSNDGKVIFYRGVSHEILGDLEAAIDQYKRYTAVSRFSRFREVISNRIHRLSRKMVTAKIKNALQNEMSLTVDNIPKNTVAVLYFNNMTSNDSLDVLMKGLAEIMAIDFSKVTRLQVVERMKIQELLKELEFSKSEYIDQSSAPRIGKILGAAQIITGAFLPINDDIVRIDAMINQSATGETHVVDAITGSLFDLILLEKKMVFQIVGDMGITLTWDEEQAIRKMPTQSLLAFIAYSRGLDYEDQGIYDLARDQYNKALQLDVNFELPNNRLNEIELQGGGSNATIPPTELLLQAFEALPKSDLPDQATFSRLVRTSDVAQLGQTTGGDNDTREPSQDAVGRSQVFGQRAHVKVKIYLPD